MLKYLKPQFMFAPDSPVADIAEPDYETTTGKPPEADISPEVMQDLPAEPDTDDRLSQITSAAKQSDEDLPGDSAAPSPKTKEPKIKDPLQTKLTPIQNAPKEGEKPVEPVKPAVKVDEPFDPAKAKSEVEKAEPRPGSHPKTVDDFRRLKTHASKALESEAKIRKEFEDFKTQAAAGPKPEEIKAKDDELAALKTRVAELENYEFMVRPEASAVLKREYDEKITKSTNSVYDLLSKLGLKEEPGEREEMVDGKPVKVPTWGLKEIKAKGGPLAYAPYSWWATNVLPNMDPLAAKKLDAQLMALHETEEARKSAIESAPAKAQEIQQKMKQEQDVKGQEWLEGAKKRVSEIEAQVPYGKPIPITNDMTPEEKQNATELNAFHEEAKALFPRLLSPQTSKEAVDIAAGFVNGLWIEKDYKKQLVENEKLSKRVEELEVKLNLRKRASDTNPSVSAPPKVNKNANDAAERIRLMNSSIEEIADEIG